MEKKEFVEAGQIVNTHGVAGELKLEVWLDSPEFMRRFKRVYIDGRELGVRASRVHKGFLLAALEGVEDVNAAMALKGKRVLIRREDAGLPKGGYFVQDIIGARVLDRQGREIGTLTEVMETPASLVYVVQGETEHLIPAVPEFIVSADPDEGVIVAELIEGM